MVFMFSIFFYFDFSETITLIRQNPKKHKNNCSKDITSNQIITQIKLMMPAPIQKLGDINIFKLTNQVSSLGRKSKREPT